MVLSSSKLFDYGKITGNQYRPKYVHKCSSSLNFQSIHNVVEAHSCVKCLFMLIIKPKPYCLSPHTDTLYTIFSLGEGGWSSWSSEPCSRTCGGGTRNRSRNCTTPNHLDCCPGNNTDVETCGEISCPSEH